MAHPRLTGSKALALLAVVVLALSACSTSSGSKSSGSRSSGAAGTSPSSASASTADKIFTWAYEREFSQYNPNTATGYLAANFVVLNGVLSGFWQFAPDGSLLPNKDFGTREKVNDNPLTVRYTINRSAVWSDGVPIDCDDFTLAWLANSGLTGERGFSVANTAGYQDQNKPQCAAGGKEITVVYRKPFADWDGLYGVGVLLPAHIVEKQAGMTKRLVDLAGTPTSPELARAIQFYNTGWAFEPGRLAKDITPSSGPYLLDSWQANRSITLKVNPRWWGTPPRTGTIVIRYLGGSRQVQALQNGEIQAMDPQPQADIVNQLKALGGKVNFSTHGQYTFEHLDFNFAGQFKDRALREAFAKCVPRQRIIDDLVKPQDPGARIYQSRFVYPSQPQYRDFENGVGGERYNTVDLAGATQLLAGRTPTVRLGWRKDSAQLNKRRAETVALIQASCNRVGFRVVDGGTPTFFQEEGPAGDFDVALFSWSGSPLVSSSDGLYETGGGQNFGGYSNPTVDADLEALSVEIDKGRQFAIMKKVDTQLWSDLATIPLFVFPAVFASVKNATGLQYNAAQADLSWNVQEWALS